MPRKTRKCQFPTQVTHPRFNEAAARCRGKHPADVRGGDRDPRRFNEAAARCRGKRK